MGGILSCNTKLAEYPYFLGNLGLYIYSMEELCYLLEKHTVLFDESFMRVDLCIWITTQNDRSALGKELKKIMDTNGSLRDFISKLIGSIHYLTMAEQQAVLKALDDNTLLPRGKRIKCRADYLVERKKYVLAVSEYKKALRALEGEQDPGILAAIMHNMGYVYAKLFLFEKAAYYFKKAFALNGDDQSKMQYLASCRFLYQKDLYIEKVVGEFNDEETALLLEEKITKILENSEENVSAAIKEVLFQKEAGLMQAYNESVDELLNKWKESYRISIV